MKLHSISRCLTKSIPNTLILVLYLVLATSAARCSRHPNIWDIPTIHTKSPHKNHAPAASLSRSSKHAKRRRQQSVQQVVRVKLVVKYIRVPVKTIVTPVPQSKIRPLEPKIDLDQQLLVAASNGDVSSAQRYLFEGAHIGAAQKDGTTAVMLAAANRRSTMVSFLIRNKFDVNRANEVGWTALRVASGKGYEDIATKLLDSGAAIDARDRNGVTALMAAVQNNQQGIVDLLIKRGAGLNVTDEWENTGLMLAAKYGQVGIVKSFLDANADIAMRNVNGVTAIDIARQCNHQDIATFIYQTRTRVSTTPSVVTQK